jgi:hypothetical protein
MYRVLALAGLFTAGCVDTFALPLFVGRDLGDGFILGDGDAPDFNPDTDGGALDLTADVDPLVLPASCAKLPCVPTRNEGDVAETSGSISGCHAYRVLTIGGAQLKVKKDPSGIGYAACAELIIIGGLVSATGEGEDEAQGPGAGKICGSGGSHAGLGADPGFCGTGSTYGDPMLPRTHGSGGGGAGAGKGGGVIELAANSVNFIAGVLNADGAPGAGISAGGGAGGSILVRADNITGAGQLNARGGLGLGLAGGGGGGGRVATWGNVSSANLTINVSGGDSMNGAADGADGTKMQLP